MDGGAEGAARDGACQQPQRQPQRQPQLAVADDEEKDPEDLLRDAGKAFVELFPLRAPRDIFGGFWAGIRCAITGAAIGIASVFTQPYEGLQESGVKGGFMGLGLGIFSGLFFTLSGVCTGLFQVLRGAWATPRAIEMASKGWRWDREARQWAEPEVYSLPEEAERVLHAADDDEEGGGPGPKRVADLYYYEQLELTSAASQREIRQAYFQQSKRWHPDKTSEPRAKEHFQAISEAYQVLSDPDRRRAYDRQGRQGAGEGFIDAHIFFNVLLGAGALEPYVGRLRLADTFGDLLSGAVGKNGDGKDEEPDVAEEAASALQRQFDNDQAQRKQVRRQLNLAVELAARLDARVAPLVGRGGSFSAAAREEVRALLKDPTLGRFIAEIGWVYKNRADSYFAKCDGSLGSFGPTALQLRLRRGGRAAVAQAKTAKLALRSFVKLRKIANEADEIADAAEEDEDALPENISSALPTFLETFWSLSAHDITGTLDKVIERVLTDASVDAAGRRHRAEGLRELGAAFMAAAEAAVGETSAAGAAAPTGADASGGGTADADSTEDARQRRRFEEALLASMESSPNSSTQHRE